MAKSIQSLSNVAAVRSASAENWGASIASRTSQLKVQVGGTNKLIDQFGRQLTHFCTTSYLGLDYHPDILSGAIDMIKTTSTLRVACSRNRCRLSILDEYEEELSAHFNVIATVTLSCSSASAAVLPLIASGVFNNDEKPVMVFDRFSHYSMRQMKAICASETQVATIDHNDVNQLEDICRRNKDVFYVADSFYSMGGISPIEDVAVLQSRYGLGLYYDDSHAMSVVGEGGVGYAMSHLPYLSDRTFIVTSLAKAFGASGGLILYGNRAFTHLIAQYGGPVNWSQSLNAAGIGAGAASLAIHRGEALSSLQRKLKENLALFDSLVTTRHRGSISPIRLVPCADAGQANRISTALAEKGYLTSPVFFPVVPRDDSAIRLTLRADMLPEEIRDFSVCLNQQLADDEDLP